jgi:hypothetical protein
MLQFLAEKGSITGIKGKDDKNLNESMGREDFCWLKAANKNYVLGLYLTEHYFLEGIQVI